MSWIDRINNIKLKIVTGDGKEYFPLWKNAIKNVNYNTEGLDFIDIDGTYVAKENIQGRQFPVEFYFQGDNYIDVSDAFEISARDKRPWKLTHPIYDDLLVQPLGLTFDNSSYNISKITGTLWETLGKKYPESSISQFKNIEVRKSAIDEETEKVFVDNIETPSPENIENANNSVLRTGRNYDLLVQIESDAALLKDKIRTASGAAQNLISNATRYIQDAIDLINFPFLIEQSINQKVVRMIDTFNDFASIFLNEATEEKLIFYESQCTTLLSELSYNLINTGVSDYETRKDVTNVINALSSNYEKFRKDLDDNSFVQDKELAIQLDYIVNFTLDNLTVVAFNSKQERRYLLDKDDNPVNLAHRFYGPGDSNLQLFISQNNIAINEYLQIKKGREIIYYV